MFVSKREFVLAHKGWVVSVITNSSLLPSTRNSTQRWTVSAVDGWAQPTASAFWCPKTTLKDWHQRRLRPGLRDRRQHPPRTVCETARPPMPKHNGTHGRNRQRPVTDNEPRTPWAKRKKHNKWRARRRQIRKTTLQGAETHVEEHDRHVNATLPKRNRVSRKTTKGTTTTPEEHPDQHQPAARYVAEKLNI